MFLPAENAFLFSETAVKYVVKGSGREYLCAGKSKRIL
jgi:hypothetical protein